MFDRLESLFNTDEPVHLPIRTSGEQIKLIEYLEKLTNHPNQVIVCRAKLELYKLYVPSDMKSEETKSTSSTEVEKIQKGFDHICDIVCNIDLISDLKIKNHIAHLLSEELPECKEALHLLSQCTESNALFFHRANSKLTTHIEECGTKSLIKVKKYAALLHLIKSKCYIAIVSLPHTKLTDKIICLTHAIQSIKQASIHFPKQTNTALRDLQKTIQETKDAGLAVTYWKCRFELSHSMADAEELYKHISSSSAAETKEIKTTSAPYAVEKSFLMTTLKSLLNNSVSDQVAILQLLAKMDDIDAQYQLGITEFKVNGKLDDIIQLLGVALLNGSEKIEPILNDVAMEWVNLPEGISFRDVMVTQIAGVFIKFQEQINKEYNDRFLPTPVSFLDSSKKGLIHLSQDPKKRVFFKILIDKLPLDMQVDIQVMMDSSEERFAQKVAEAIAELKSMGTKENILQSIHQANATSDKSNTACWISNQYYWSSVEKLQYWNKMARYIATPATVNHWGDFNMGQYYYYKSINYWQALYHYQSAYATFVKQANSEYCLKVIEQVFNLAKLIKIPVTLILQYGENALTQYASLSDENKKKKLLKETVSFLLENSKNIPATFHASFIGLLDKIIKLPSVTHKQMGDDHIPALISLCRTMTCSDKAAPLLELVSFDFLKKLAQPAEGKSEEKSGERTRYAALSELEKRTLNKTKKYTAESLCYLRERLRLADAKQLTQIEAELKTRHEKSFSLSMYDYHLKKSTTSQQKHQVLARILKKINKSKNKARKEHLSYLAADIGFDLAVQNHSQIEMNKAVECLINAGIFNLPIENFKNVFSHYKNVLDQAATCEAGCFLIQAYQKMGDIDSAMSVGRKIIQHANESKEDKVNRHKDALKAIKLLVEIARKTPGKKHQIESILVAYFRDIFEVKADKETMVLQWNGKGNLHYSEGIKFKADFPAAAACFPSDLWKACENYSIAFKDVKAISGVEFIALDLYSQGIKVAKQKYDAFFSASLYQVSEGLSCYHFTQEKPVLSYLKCIGMKRLHSTDKEESLTGAQHLLEAAQQFLRAADLITGEKQTLTEEALSCLSDPKLLPLLTDRRDLEKLDALLEQLSRQNIPTTVTSLQSLGDLFFKRKMTTYAIHAYKHLATTENGAHAISGLKNLAEEEKDEKQLAVIRNTVIAYHARPAALPEEYPTLKLWQRKIALREEKYNEMTIKKTLFDFKSQPGIKSLRDQTDYVDALIKRAFHRIANGAILDGLQDYKEACSQSVKPIEPVLELWPSLVDQVMGSAETEENRRKALHIILEFDRNAPCHTHLLALKDIYTHIREIKQTPLSDDKEVIRVCRSAFETLNKDTPEHARMSLGLEMLTTLLKSAATLPLDEKTMTREQREQQTQFYSLGYKFLHQFRGVFKEDTFGGLLAPYYNKNVMANFFVKYHIKQLEANHIQSSDFKVDHTAARLTFTASLNVFSSDLYSQAWKQNILFSILKKYLQSSGFGVDEEKETNLTLGEKDYLRQNNELPQERVLAAFREANLTGFMKKNRKMAGIQALKKYAEAEDALAAFLLVKIYIKAFKENNRKIEECITCLENMSRYGMIFLRLSEDPLELAKKMNTPFPLINQCHYAIGSWLAFYKANALTLLDQQPKLDEKIKSDLRLRIGACSSEYPVFVLPPSVSPTYLTPSSPIEKMPSAISSPAHKTESLYPSLIPGGPPVLSGSLSSTASMLQNLSCSSGTLPVVSCSTSAMDLEEQQAALVTALPVASDTRSVEKVVVPESKLAVIKPVLL